MLYFLAFIAGWFLSLLTLPGVATGIFRYINSKRKERAWLRDMRSRLARDGHLWSLVPRQDDEA